jgi:hypothetical protein
MTVTDVIRVIYDLPDKVAWWARPLARFNHFMDKITSKKRVK